MTVVGSYGRVSDEVPIGFRIGLQPGMASTAGIQTRRSARIKGEKLGNGPFGAIVGKLGMRAAIATPIVVAGRYWGVTVAATSRADFPAGTESRMADFMELAATAIADARADQELREIADTQAALRRLAMPVARGEPPEAVFAGATREALRHFGNGDRPNDPLRARRNGGAPRRRRHDRPPRAGRETLGGLLPTQPAGRRHGGVLRASGSG
jgi:hypothetical protein